MYKRDDHCWQRRIYRLSKHICFSPMVMFIIILTTTCFLTAGHALAAPSIKAATVSIPQSLEKNLSVNIDLESYWRSNVVIENGALSGQKQAYASHVPALVEYNVAFGAGGEYALEAQYSLTEAGTAVLTIDGESVGEIFSEAHNSGDSWESIGRFSVRPGEHRIRITSHYVETPFPNIKAMRLVFKGGDVPPQAPEPQVVGYRQALPKDWYKTISRKIHGDFHTGGFIKGIGKNFDPEEYALTLKNNNINSIAIFAKGHHGYAYYNTKVGTRHPGLDFDLMKAQIDACHKHGIAVWVYLSIAIDEIYGSTQEGQQGKVTDHFLRVSAETDTRYVTDYTWPMITECVRDYDIDGFFFDFPGNEAFVQETIKLIKSIKPGIAIAYNHQWDKSRAELAKLDILEIESWMHKQTLYHWQYVARYARGAVPLTAMTTCFWKGWGDFGGVADEAMMRYDVATGLANGCSITMGDQLHPYGKLDADVYSRIGRAMDYAVKIEPYVFDSESVPYVALLKQSEKTCALLVDAGIHFAVVDETQYLSPFKMLIIPDCASIGSEYLAKVEAYVNNGGRLFATGTPGNEMAALLGVEIDSELNAEPAYIRVDNAFLPTPPATSLYSYGDMIPVRSSSGTKTIAPLVWALNHGTTHHVSHRQSPAMDTDSGYAALTIRDVGKGLAVYSAAPLFDTYATMGFTAMREIAEDAIRLMIPPGERLAEVEATATLEVSVNRQGGRTIIHLVHCPQSRRVNSTFDTKDYVHNEPVIDGLTTVAGTVIKVPASMARGKTIMMPLTGETLRIESVNDGVALIRVPDFQIGTVLVIE